MIKVVPLNIEVYRYKQIIDRLNNITFLCEVYIFSNLFHALSI